MTNQVKITYCLPCGYLKRATAVAEALQEKLNIKAELIPGSGGIFKVEVGSETVAKRAVGYFPSPDEVVTAAADATKS